MSKLIDVFKNGLIKNNPAFRLVLGACPTLAVTTSAINGLSMGLATMFVLVCSNTIISLLRGVIPDKVRIPSFILVIATFVTIVQMVMKRYLPDLNESLGLFIPLIVVNCLILARAEAFASVNAVVESSADGFGMGIGFTLALTLIGLVREFLGAGAVFGYEIAALEVFKMSIFVFPAGAFFIYGFLMVGFNGIAKKIAERKEKKDSKEVIA